MIIYKAENKINGKIYIGKEEKRRKLSIASSGKKASEETKKKMSEAQIKRFAREKGIL